MAVLLKFAFNFLATTLHCKRGREGKEEEVGSISQQSSKILLVLFLYPTILKPEVELEYNILGLGLLGEIGMLLSLICSELKIFPNLHSQRGLTC